MAGKRKFTQEELQERHEKMIVIQGKDLQWEQIAHKYELHIESGFDVTIEEMANYFGCKPLYIMLHIRPLFRHIVISSVARKFLLRAMAEGEIDESVVWRPLIKKRLLFLREDFELFIKELPVQVCYDYLRWSDLKAIGAFEHVKQEEAAVSLSQAIQSLYGSTTVEPEDEIIRELSKVPEKLYSLQELKLILNHKYNVDTYRWLKSKCANKIHVNNLVRYDITEFETAAAAVPIHAFAYEGREQVFKGIVIMAELIQKSKK